MSTEIPADLAPLLDATAVAFVSTIGPNGDPQTTPIWFLWEAGTVRFSLVEGRQKLRNLRRDPRASVVVVDPADPTRYLELSRAVRSRGATAAGGRLLDESEDRWVVDEVGRHGNVPWLAVRAH